MIERDTLSKIGIGAWGLGGFAKHEPNNDDEKQIKAVSHALRKGFNFIEVNYWNSEGYSLEIITQAIKNSKVSRENIFLSQAIYDYNLETIKEVEAEFEKVLEKFETPFMDSLEFSMPAFRKYGFNELAELIEKYLSSGKIRYTGITNADLDLLKKYREIFKDKLFLHELCFNYEIRANEDLGITGYASENSIFNVPYQPLRRNRTANRNWPLLIELSEKYNKTQNQIILNWLVSKGFRPLNKSENIDHINENLEALNFNLEKEDFDRIDHFRVTGYKIPKIDWWQTGGGTKIHMLPNVFDEQYPNN
jgi:diketogulonate reductase-like aldo/keto reductase